MASEDILQKSNRIIVYNFDQQYTRSRLPFSWREEILILLQEAHRAIPRKLYKEVG